MVQRKKGFRNSCSTSKVAGCLLINGFSWIACARTHRLCMRRIDNDNLVTKVVAVNEELFSKVTGRRKATRL